jgi:phosphate transport system permease protein
MNPIYLRRRGVNTFAMVAAFAATILGLFWLGAILWTLVSQGIDAIGIDIFTKMTPPPGSAMRFSAAFS